MLQQRVTAESADDFNINVRASTYKRQAPQTTASFVSNKQQNNKQSRPNSATASPSGQQLTSHDVAVVDKKLTTLIKRELPQRALSSSEIRQALRVKVKRNQRDQSYRVRLPTPVIFRQTSSPTRINSTAPKRSPASSVATSTSFSSTLDKKSSPGTNSPEDSTAMNREKDLTLEPLSLESSHSFGVVPSPPLLTWSPDSHSSRSHRIPSTPDHQIEDLLTFFEQASSRIDSRAPSDNTGSNRKAVYSSVNSSEFSTSPISQKWSPFSSESSHQELLFQPHEDAVFTPHLAPTSKSHSESDLRKKLEQECLTTSSVGSNDGVFFRDFEDVMLRSDDM